MPYFLSMIHALLTTFVPTIYALIPIIAASIPSDQQPKYFHEGNENKPLIATQHRANEQSESKFNLPGLWRGAFDRRFWILTLGLMCFYASYLSFTNVGSSFLQSKYKMTFEQGNEILPIPLFISAFTIPLFGFIADKYGKRGQLLIFSGILLTLSHIILGFSPPNSKYYAAVPGLICFGFGMSIGSSILWPAVGLICTKQYLATAFGFMGCFDNGWQGISFLIVGVLTKDTDTQQDVSKYQYVSYWVIFLAVVYDMCVVIVVF